MTWVSGVNKLDRFWSKVDKSGECWLWTASKTPEGYGIFRVGNRMVGAHCVSYDLAYGELEAGLTVDHKCKNESCVRPEHLRSATRKQQCENRKGWGKSGVRGVRQVRNKWAGRVRHFGKEYYVGLFATKEDANVAVIAKRNELFTHNQQGE